MHIANVVVASMASALVFLTGAPGLQTGAGGANDLMSLSEYRTVMAKMGHETHFVPIRQLPPKLSTHARFGLNWVVGTQNRGWILDGDDRHGWVLYLDWKGDGDLSHAKPQPFDHRHGVFQLQVQVSDYGLHYPCQFVLTNWKSAAGKRVLVVAINESEVRRGIIEINGSKIRFSLFGDFGHYGRDGPLQSMSIDRVGAVPQRYENYERYLNLFDKSYAFAIDPRGASLSLTPLAERRPDRPLLTVGSQAPEFVATNINGAKLSLPQYRGRMLLVEFWSIFCEPCRYETPQMVSFYRSTRRQDLEFLGVADDAPEADLRQFLSANGMKWTQIREPWSGNVHRLFRVDGMPTYFLIGRAGEILATWIGAGKAVSTLTKFLPASK